MISTAEATAQVFWTAFRALPKREREAFIERLFHEEEFVEDLMDVALLVQRENEPSRPLDEYAAERKKDGH